jgi:hypothetical protein
MPDSKHIINILTFSHPEKELTFGFKQKKANGHSPLRKGEFPKELWAKQLKSFPLPVKLHLQSTDETIINDPEEVNKLIDQVYQFSHMYWKSLRQQNLPVTIKYPEMVAQIAPHFIGNDIPDYRKNNLWFL